jgi:hypothetical protein
MSGDLSTLGSSEQADKKLIEDVQAAILGLLGRGQQPSVWELVKVVEDARGLHGRVAITEVLGVLAQSQELRGLEKQYCEALLNSEDLADALRGGDAPSKAIKSSFDALIERGKTYRNSGSFRELVTFMGRFKEYAPFNNMLVRVQNPACSFFASEKDWWGRFEKRLKEDARPMLILAPMHPVMLVYDQDQVQGGWTPAELEAFARFEGEPRQGSLQRLIENAAMRDLIRVDIKPLSSTLAGFATIARGDANSKMRIALHQGLDEPSKVGVLCHELAHIYLGHLGGDPDRWWPSRTGISRRCMEIEAESVAYLVTTRMGLNGSSSAYVSRYLPEGELPLGVSIDVVAKVAGRIEEMATHKQQARRAKAGTATERTS